MPTASMTTSKGFTLATGATFAGYIASVFRAPTLVRAFSGKGLVRRHIVLSWPFTRPTAAAIAAGTWQLIETI
jgi:hypothetical protein